MAIPVSTVIAWLESLGWDAAEEDGAPLKPGPFVPDMPDRLVVVTSTPGPGYVLEAAADAQAFQARVRGSQGSYDDAEALALALDGLILNAPFPVITGGCTLIWCRRLGSQPSPLAPGPDPGDRTEFTCQYVLTASTT